MYFLVCVVLGICRVANEIETHFHTGIIQIHLVHFGSAVLRLLVLVLKVLTAPCKSNLERYVHCLLCGFCSLRTEEVFILIPETSGCCFWNLFSWAVLLKSSNIKLERKKIESMRISDNNKMSEWNCTRECTKCVFHELEVAIKALK